MGGSTHLDDLTSSLSMGRTSPPNVKITSKNTILQSPKIAGQTNPLNVDNLPIRIHYFPLLEIIEGYCTLSPHWAPAVTAKSPLASALPQSLASLVGIFSTRIPLIDILNVSKSSRIRSPRNNPEAKKLRFSDPHQNWILWHQQSWRWANVQFFFAFRTHQRWVYDMF